MKKYIVLIGMVIVTTNLFSQIFSTPETLKKGQFSIGLNPTYYNDNFGFFIHGGAGLKRNIDFELSYGFLDGQNYLGLNAEWGPKQGKFDVSFTGGDYVLGDVALDTRIDLGFNIKGDTELYSGLDADVVFDSDPHLLLWIPVGIELGFANKLALIIEEEIPLVSPAFTIFGGGINMYL